MRFKFPNLIYRQCLNIFNRSYARMDKIISLGREMTDVLRENTMLYNPNLEIIQIENLGDINSIYPFDMFRYGKWNEAAKVPIGLSGPAALYDFIYGDQIIDEKEYMEKVYPTHREFRIYVCSSGSVVLHFNHAIIWIK